jgi:nicotinic acid mononucleotide adenylyltransferase
MKTWMSRNSNSFYAYSTLCRKCHLAWIVAEREKGKLWIRFRVVASNMLYVEIEDNGIGREKAAEMKTKDLIKQKIIWYADQQGSHQPDQQSLQSQ